MNIRTLLLICSLMFAAATAFAKEEFGTAKEAEAMVVKAVAAVKANKQKTLDEVTGKDAKWVDRDLYVSVMDMSGKTVAHAVNQKMVGREMIDFRDVDGKLYVQERMELAKSKGKFWQDFKFTDPLTKRLLAKSAYCEKADDLVVCVGVYKR